MEKLIILVLSIFILCGFQCDDDCETEIYDTSKITMSISPEVFNINIGDTIKMSTSPESSFLLDESQVFKDQSNDAVVIYFDLFEIESDNEPIVNGVMDIEIDHNGHNIMLIGNFNGITRAAQWICGADMCPLEINLIPQVKGYFGIRLLYGYLEASSECEDYTLINNAFDTFGNNIENLMEINTNEISFGDSVLLLYDAEIRPEELHFFKVD